MVDMKMLSSHSILSTFGEMLRYLRRRAHLTQRELSIAVGYSESMISRLEHGERPPDIATLMALFVPALQVADEPDIVAQLMALAQAARRKGATLRTGGGSEPREKSLAKSLEHYSPAALRLPYRLTSFIGRDREVASVSHLLLQARLVTLTGPGGCGKTSLAVETARWLADKRTLDGQTQTAPIASPLFADGIYLVEFLPLSDPGLLVRTILSALGLEGNPVRVAQETLVRFLDKKSVLLILDNCEHLIDPVARLVETLLRSCPNLRVLATSRERLNLPGEVLFEVPALAFPDLQRLPKPDNLLDFVAVQLFVERCQAIEPGFHLTTQNALAVAQICALLDGIPLALELAAAALTTFSVQEIAAQLDTRFLLSSPGYRTADPRRRTLNDAVAWSYHLLALPERRLLARLAVFVGGWTLDALEAVCQHEADCVLLLRQLVQKSLVRVEHNSASADDRTRYHLLRAVRDYALERLGEDAEEDAVHRRHFFCYARLGNELGAEVLSPQHQRAMAGLNADYQNIRAALLYATDKIDLIDKRAQLAASLSYYWRLRGYVHEGVSWLQAAIADEDSFSLSTRARVYVALLALNGGELFQWNRNMRVLRESERLLATAEMLIEPCLAQGDSLAAALLMLTVAGMVDYHGDVRKAEQYATAALYIFQASNDWRNVAFAHNLCVRIALVQGEIQSALAIQEKTVRFLEQHGANWGLCEL